MVQLGDHAHRSKMLEYVLLSGGNTLVKGFDDRVKRELTMVCPINT